MILGSIFIKFFINSHIEMSKYRKKTHIRVFLWRRHQIF